MLPSPLTCLTLSLAIVATAVATGCKRDNAVENLGTDSGFIRIPGEKTASLEMPSGPILPLTPGAFWIMATRSREGAATEEIRVTNTQKIGNATGVTLDMRKEGKSYRQEIFQNTAHDLFLLGAGSEDKMSITPPIPLVKYPVTEGDIQAWTGILRFKNTSAPGTAFSRISAIEAVKTAAGSFPCYRVDTVISTTVQGRQVAFPTTRWFSPKVGIVKQRILAGDATLIKEMQSYKIP